MFDRIGKYLGQELLYVWHFGELGSDRVSFELKRNQIRYGILSLTNLLGVHEWSHQPPLELTLSKGCFAVINEVIE